MEPSRDSSSSGAVATEAGLLDRLADETDPIRRDALVRELACTVGAKDDEVTRYLDPGRTSARRRRPA